MLQKKDIQHCEHLFFSEAATARTAVTLFRLKSIRPYLEMTNVLHRFELYHPQLQTGLYEYTVCFFSAKMQRSYKQT